jgi:hypothetical protein
MFGMRRNLTSRELIKFAKELRDRTEPLRFMIPDDGKTTKITSDIIELSEDLDKEEPIELNDDNTIKNMSKNFNIKKRRRK